MLNLLLLSSIRRSLKVFAVYGNHKRKRLPSVGELCTFAWKFQCMLSKDSIHFRQKIEALCQVECVWERGTEGRPEPCTPRVIKLLQTACFIVCENWYPYTTNYMPVIQIRCIHTSQSLISKKSVELLIMLPLITASFFLFASIFFFVMYKQPS